MFFCSFIPSSFFSTPSLSGTHNLLFCHNKGLPPPSPWAQARAECIHKVRQLWIIKGIVHLTSHWIKRWANVSRLDAPSTGSAWMCRPLPWVKVGSFEPKPYPARKAPARAFLLPVTAHWLRLGTLGKNPHSDSACSWTCPQNLGG